VQQTIATTLQLGKVMREGAVGDVQNPNSHGGRRHSHHCYRTSQLAHHNSMSSIDA
jgi:hypothetical protein